MTIAKPMFYELASSLNVELVYVILKSITQFAYVKAASNGHAELSREANKKKIAPRLEIDTSTGDAKLHLTQIKVKNSSTWQ